MGIRKIFDQSSANLSKINDNFYVSALLHKSKIQVTEEGTIAAAVSGSILANKSSPPKFNANKPFLYFVVDKATKLILLSGQYAIPEQF